MNLREILNTPLKVADPRFDAALAVGSLAFSAGVTIAGANLPEATQLGLSLASLAPAIKTSYDSLVHARRHNASEVQKNLDKNIGPAIDKDTSALKPAERLDYAATLDRRATGDHEPLSADAGPGAL